jgi:CRISPR-associated endoribonuclease Cas6
MPDLVALALPLIPLKNPIEPTGFIQDRRSQHSLGQAAHGWFMHSVARLDPALAARLHDEAGPRAFTLWPALGSDEPFLRVTSIDPALTAFLLDRWLPNLSPPIMLGQVAFNCGPVAQRPVQHPWAGQTSYANLMQTAAGRRDDALNLTFATPTLFRSNNLDVPLPLPTLIFDGLLQKWNCFAPAPMNADLKLWIETHVAVGRYQLKTHLLAFGHNGRDAMPGFQGQCRLVFVRGDPIRQAMVRALAGFTFYAGIGRRTAMGMGQARVATRSRRRE